MKTYFYGNQNADKVLIQLVGEHDLPLMEQEYAYILDLMAGSKDNPEILLAAVLADNWNEELSPWTAPPVFGKEGFGDGATKTLTYLQEELLPKNLVSRAINVPRKTFYIGGYSLAGLFALWAAYQTDLFAGVAAVSPSVWFPGFLDYVRSHTPQIRAIYLSLGDKEEKTRNRVMAQVGSSIREIYNHLLENGSSCILEWNAGNHFQDPALRTAKGWTWLLQQSLINHK